MSKVTNFSTENNPNKEELEKEKEYIEVLIAKSGMKPSDPLFKLYAQMGTTQYAIMQLPGKLDTVIAGWTLEVDKTLKDAAEVAIVQQRSAIAKAAQELIRKQNASSSLATGLGSLDVSNFKLAQISLILGYVLALGVAIGAFTFNMAIASQSSGKSPVTANLKPEDATLLEWAKSKEGRDARQIYKRNAGIIRTCRQGKNPGGCIIDASNQK
ncbi:hypothetical protein QUB80_28250 [Chlorogloeopsis sp. ULAP01]|uniref:DUF6753 family protein n=1 Tax=Chlorogloeopsis sp. ULAP01 TaxID=3056483 RepID=UPI0025AA6907|nr:DUF6753 family protein [Chlorogloeopsis sp. ULAP01]MDM9384564.1 hypothetical protein [Chlorogloeopsis sp. ULAP01]